jgi:hypothetical protein
VDLGKLQFFQIGLEFSAGKAFAVIAQISVKGEGGCYISSDRKERNNIITFDGLSVGGNDRRLTFLFGLEQGQDSTVFSFMFDGDSVLVHPVRKEVLSLAPVTPYNILRYFLWGRPGE